MAKRKLVAKDMNTIELQLEHCIMNDIDILIIEPQQMRKYIETSGVEPKLKKTKNYYGFYISGFDLFICYKRN